jgi:flagellar biosynthesis/type III secretory pathway chaperone
MKINKLTDTLSTQLGLLEELHTLLEQETNELAEINLDAMAEVNRLKEDISARIEEHTVHFLQVVEEAAVSLMLPKDCALGELAATFAKQGNKEIPALHKKLNKVAQQVRQTATMNREIADRFVATVNTSLNFLTRIINQSSVYGASGGYQQRPSGAVIINREA